MSERKICEWKIGEVKTLIAEENLRDPKMPAISRDPESRMIVHFDRRYPLSWEIKDGDLVKVTVVAITETRDLRGILRGYVLVKPECIVSKKENRIKEVLKPAISPLVKNYLVAREDMARRHADEEPPWHKALEHRGMRKRKKYNMTTAGVAAMHKARVKRCREVAMAAMLAANNPPFEVRLSGRISAKDQSVAIYVPYAEVTRLLNATGLDLMKYGHHDVQLVVRYEKPQ